MNIVLYVDAPGILIYYRYLSKDHDGRLIMYKAITFQCINSVRIFRSVLKFTRDERKEFKLKTWGNGELKCVNLIHILKRRN